MAESGSIYAKLLLDESAFITSLRSALNNANDTFGKIIGLGDKTSQAFDKTQKSIAGMGKENTLAGLNERLQRLNGILDKTQIGSQRFQQIQKEIDATKTKIDEAGNKLGAFGKLFDTLGKVGINIPVAGVAGAIAGLSSVVSIAGEYEKQVTELGAASGATGAQFDQLKAKARELGSTTSFSAKEAAQGMTELAKAGMNTNQVLGATEHVLNLAKAGSLGLAEASTIAADTMASFGLKTDDAAQSAVNMQRISDNLAKAANASTISVQEVGETFKYVAGVANSLSVSLEKTSAMTALLGNEGIKASSAGTALKSILLNLSAPTTGGVKALAQLGLSEKDFKDAKGNLKDVSDIFEILNKKTAGMGNTQKASIFKDLFGTESVTAAVAIVNKAEKNIKDSSGKMISELDQLEKQMGEVGFAKKYGDALSDNFQGALKSLQSAVEEIVLLVGDLVLPIVRPLAEVANVIINVLGGAIRFLIRPFQLLFQILNEFVSKSVQGFALLAGAAFVFKGALLALVPAITAALAPLIAFVAANPIVLAIGAAVLAVAVFLAYIDNLKAAWAEVWKAASSTFDDLSEIIGFAVSTVAELFGEFNEGNSILSDIEKYFVDIADSVREFWKWLSETKILMTVIKVLFSPIVIAVNLLVAGVKIFMSALSAVIDIVKTISDNFSLLKNLFSDFFDSLSDSFGKIKNLMNFGSVTVEADTSPAEDSMESLSAKAEKIFAVMKDIDLGKIFKEKFEQSKQAFTDFVNSGRQLLSKIFDSLKNSALVQFFKKSADEAMSALSPLIDFAKSIISNIIGTFNNLSGAVSKSFSSAVENVNGFLFGIADSVRTAFSDAKAAILKTGDDIVKFFRNIPANIAGFFRDNFRGLYDAFNSLLVGLTTVMNSILSTVTKFFSGMLDTMKKGWENIKKYFSSESEAVQGGAQPAGDKPKPQQAPVFAPPGSGSGKTKEAVEDLDQFLKRAIAIDKMGKEGIEFKVSMPLEEFKFNQKEIEKFAKDQKIQITPEFKYNKDSKDSVKAEAEVTFKIPDGVTEKEKAQLLSKLKRMQAQADSGSIKPVIEPQVKMEALNQFHSTALKVNDDLAKISQSSGFEKIARGIQLASDTLGQLGNGFTEMLSATAKLASVKFDNFKQNLSFLSQGMTKLIDDNLKNTINKINEETNLRVKGFDDQLAALKAQKEAELALEEQFQTDLKLLKAQMDADSKAENDRLFAETWAKRQEDYDNQKALIEAGTADTTEKAISEQALLAQAEEEKAALRAQFDQRLVDQVANNQANIDAQTAAHEAQKAAKDKERDDKEKAINDAKTAYLAEQENKRTQAQDIAEQKKNEIKRNSALLEWFFGRGAFEANKRAQLAGVQVSMATTIMNAMAAWAMIVAQTGLPGVIIGGAVASMITAMALAAGATSMSAISAAQYPPPPIMAEGGLIGGMPHSAGGTMVNAERGEFIVNAADTARNIDTLQAINSGSFSQNSGQTVNVYIGDTKIFSGQNMGPDAIARMASERIRQDIYQAVSR